MKIFLKMFVFCVVLSVLLFSGGCSNRKETGKFSDEQIESFPLARRGDLPAPSGGLVLSVGTETVTSDEIVVPLVDRLTPLAIRSDYDEFVKQAGPLIASAVKDKVVDMLVYKRARSDAPDNIDRMIEKAVEGETNRFIARYGGNYAEAEKALKKGGMDWNRFKEYQARMILTQSYMQKEIPDDLPITHGELIDYYNMVKAEKYQQPGYIEFRLIDIDVEKVAVAEGADKKRVALDKADEIVAKINNGDDFGELAKRYSHGHKAAAGGLWQRVSLDSLAEPYSIIESLCHEMPAGQFTGPIDYKGHLFIVKLEAKQTENNVPFEQVQKDIETELKFVKRRILFDKMITGLVAQANIPNMEGFIDFCIDLAYRKAMINR
ncbi:MAG: peptidyl-prolyl cis-trans isomerase [Planctomycetes bacterium]|nr:peptidyl-prolyl cis-trans isomerase [Planctomycetota bacterium]